MEQDKAKRKAAVQAATGAADSTAGPAAAGDDDDKNCDVVDIISKYKSLQSILDDLMSYFDNKCDFDNWIVGSDDEFSQLIAANPDYFRHYFYYLRKVSEGHGYFYDKALELASISFQRDKISREKDVKKKRKYQDFGGLFTDEEVEILINSLARKIVGCKPCIQMSNGMIPFCIDPFYINETLSWSSNSYDSGWVSEPVGLKCFMKRMSTTDKIIKSDQKKCDVMFDPLDENSVIPRLPIRPTAAQPLVAQRRVDSSEDSEVTQCVVEDSVTADLPSDVKKFKRLCKENGLCYKLLLEQYNNRDAFQKIQLYITLLKFVFNIYTLLGFVGRENIIENKLTGNIKMYKKFFISSS